MSLNLSLRLKKNTFLLWRLIRNRDINSEVSKECEELAAAGIDVNLSDSLDNNNTALHCAVIRNDIKCVEFLLKLNPDLGKRNGSHETAEDLARRLDTLNIDALLRLKRFKRSGFPDGNESGSSSSSKRMKRELFSVNQDYVGLWNIHDIQSLSPNVHLRVLKIQSCGKGSSAIDQIKTREFQEFFEKSTSLLVLILETSSVEPIKNFADLLPWTRQLIIQLTRGDSTEIHFKDDQSKEFKIINKFHLNENVFEVKMKLKVSCSFDTVLSGLSARMSSKFDGNLLNLRVEFTTLVEIAQSAARFNCLSNRFLQLFMPSNGDSIFDALEFNGAGRFIAALEWMKLLGNDDLLIKTAIRRNNTEALAFLVQHVDVSQSQSFANMAWQSKHFDCLNVLLLHGSPFPDSFNRCQVDSQIGKLLSEREQLFQSIQNGLREDVQGFIERNPQTKVIYDANNETAVSFAFKSKQYTIYAMLIAQGFNNGICLFNWREAEDELLFEDKVVLGDAKRQFFTSSIDHHIIHLLAKSKTAIVGSASKLFATSTRISTKARKEISF
jgi:hypothetical protein